ncbi:MAG: deoxyribonuclease IV [Pseudodesulfovibrio sp.]|uniref:Probable endonuclease 4 n=1 Tax=Pseudodesulfovibrio aespoeensis (strain ATCC 700646 / DSM 10631 / Aspo-2) TaxID=643562 RepID=E6VSD7_PSEA9|nr:MULTISPECIES: deoxyribonuclease IV [Pseudodesulfovibrio]MBU4192295.1 deoxyribonuclease IV [Pseudomonadota bacterium]ADU64280.1 apurinic endonuclease Apn1 [Pseudodesulfovibrio aespoeensis Aspo-2]MBU4243682.1 deoxyribonuclease IV [Pseudomonadota bacterium]MBU4378408.1 deoxyribonuclease IV [Pseudomonadota bacterium]MBU4475650.1 deoxyribonuclease IV [Pseudomonadota bacterium]
MTPESGRAPAKCNDLLGAHMSIAGGLHMAFEHIRAAGGTALQIFTRNQRQWRIPELSAYDADLFAMAWSQWGDSPVAAHDSYLINLASPDPDLLERSRAAFAEELRRVETLNIPYLVTHPGSHLGQGVDAGIVRYAAALDQAIDQAMDRSPTSRAMILLETTAGQGTNLGSTFEELARIMELSRHADRLGVCYDTCHTFAAGYDIRTPEAYAATFDHFDRIIGLPRLRFFHLNDTKSDFASRKDRHEHIGQGAIGLEGFRLLMRDPRFVRVPKVLETPKDKDLADDVRNLTLLRRLAGGEEEHP